MRSETSAPGMKSKLPIILVLIIILFWSWFVFLKVKYWNNKKQIVSQNQQMPSKDLKDYLNSPENTKDPDFVEAKKSLENWDIKNSISLWEKVVKKDEEAWKFKQDNSQDNNLTISKPKVNSKIILAQTYLKYWNYYYKENENAQKAEILLKSLPDLDSNYFALFELAYAYEIRKRYTEALKYYNEALALVENDKQYKSITLNQIGHVYDLKWDFDKVFDYYNDAYKLDNKNFMASGNIWRFLVRTNKIKESIPYFEYALYTNDLSFRSELYYALSSIELELNWLKPDIDKSIIYAKEWIKSFPYYPMNYVAIARWLYMKNDKKYYKEIEDNLTKSIQMNPNGFAAYKYYALHMFDKWDISTVSVLMSKSNEVLDKDIILMHNVIETERKINTIFMQTMIILDKINKEWWKDNELINKILVNDYFKWFIDLQKKRKNNWVLHAFLK